MFRFFFLVLHTAEFFKITIGMGKFTQEGVEFLMAVIFLGDMQLPKGNV